MSCVEAEQVIDTTLERDISDAWSAYMRAETPDEMTMLYRIWKRLADRRLSIHSTARDQSLDVVTRDSDSESVGAGVYQEHA